MHELGQLGNGAYGPLVAVLEKPGFPRIDRDLLHDQAVHMAGESFDEHDEIRIAVFVETPVIHRHPLRGADEAADVLLQQIFRSQELEADSEEPRSRWDHDRARPVPNAGQLNPAGATIIELSDQVEVAV